VTERWFINEVGLRDGLQNQAVPVSTAQKLELAHALVSAGVQAMEATSFVSPKAVPQMADADALFAQLPGAATVGYSALIPNARGLDRALAAGVRELALVLSATETMNQRNINMGLLQARETCVETLSQMAKHPGLRSKVYVAVAFECPFEGLVAPERVHQLAAAMFAAGAHEVVVADTIGAASPKQIGHVMPALLQQFGADRLSLHLHDTRGMGSANAFAASQLGVRKFDSSVGGLGGCPFAPGASGNLATEDLVLLAQQQGFDTGIDLDKLLDAVAVASRITQRPLGGKSHAWLLRQKTQRDKARLGQLAEAA
jgi:hydroxymethylglutaryl-CoA lyase